MTCKPLSIHKGDTESLFQVIWWKPYFEVQKRIAQTLKENFAGTPVEDLASAQESVFETMQENMNRFFAEVYNTRQMASSWMYGDNTEPYIDVIESKDAFKIRAELPGVKEQDIDLSIVEGGLMIKGEKYEHMIEEGENYMHKECHAGCFCRSVALPSEADLERASAELSLNVLTIAVPKIEAGAVKPGAGKKGKIGVVSKQSINENAKAVAVKKPAGSPRKNSSAA